MPDQLLRQVLEGERSKAIYDSIGLVTNYRYALQTTLLFHKRLQHFTAVQFLVHTGVTLAN
jgi:hypothetical protein